MRGRISKGLAPRRAEPFLEAPSGPRRRQRHGAAAYLEKGSRSMSRMTLLDGNVWLSLSAPRALSGTGKAGDGGYPPSNIELLPGGERGPEGLRVTLAVAGFSADDLEVSIEEGELIIRGRHREEQAREYLHRGIPARQV